MTGARNNGTRKSMRAIPLTQRQRKHGKPESAAHQSASPQGKGARGSRGGRPALILPSPAEPIAPIAPIAPAELLAQTTPLVSLRPTSPLDLNAESGASQALNIPTPPVSSMDSLDMQDTMWLSAPPKAETPPVVMTSPSESGELQSAAPDSAAPRRVKVRVRRKLPTPTPQIKAADLPLDMEETAILPGLGSAPQSAAPSASTQSASSSVTLNIVLDSETTVLVRSGETPPSATPPSTVETPPTRASALDIETTLLNPSIVKVTPPRVAPPARRPALDIETTVLSRPIETPPAVETPPTRASALDTETTVLNPSVVKAAPVESAPADTADTADAPASDEPAPEPRPSVTTRKLPTLAVMAALATRAEARAEANALEDTRAEPHEVPTEAPADAPREEPREEPRAAEALEQPEAKEAPDVSDAPLDTSDETLLSDLRALLEDASAQPAPLASLTRPGGRRGRSASQPLAPAAAPGDASPPGRRRMWWLNTPHTTQDEGEERATPDSAPNAQSARPTVAPWMALETLARPRPITQPPAPRRAPPITRQLNREPAPARGVSQPRPSQPSGGRVSRVEEEPATLLVWVGVAQAALCGGAAFVAAIALLNGAAGARAVSVFGWAIAFALIAGTGAGLGHLAGRVKRARQATLALLLSQLGLLVWALALLGARPALMALIPFCVALALRSLGRGAAAMTALAALALFTLTLTLNVSGWWSPTASLAPTPAAVLDTILVIVGMTLTALALVSLYAAGERERARIRAIERAARLATIERDNLRTQTEDDANTLRQALSNALRGVPTEGVRARGALSPLAEQVGVVAERLVDLSYEREERKKLESAARRLIRNIERAWLGLSWEWPEASGVILDDLVALLRTPPPSEPAQLPEDTSPTGQVVAPHLYRAWQPGVSIPSQPLTAQPGLWPDRSAPSQPSGVWPTLWPSDPEPAAPGTDPLSLPPSPRWRNPDEESRAPESASVLNGFNGAHQSDHLEAADLDTTMLWP